MCLKYHLKSACTVQYKTHLQLDKPMVLVSNSCIRTIHSTEIGKDEKQTNMIRNKKVLDKNIPMTF
jgi:hypothetical protein